MIYLDLDDVLELQKRLIAQSGGTFGVRDLGLVDSALALPRMTFDAEELYSSLADKAAALAFSLIRNHGFVDGNKRIGHAAMEVFLIINGHELSAGVDEHEAVILQVVANQISREAFAEWVRLHIVAKI